MEKIKDVEINELKFQLMLDAATIENRIDELGRLLRERYASLPNRQVGDSPVFLGVLNGSFIFMADLVRAYENPCEVSFIRLSSYDGLASSGEVLTVIGLTDPLEGRDVIIVEDIIDSGKTMDEFLPTLKEMNPNSITLVTFLLKPDALKYDFPIDIIGFEIPDKFVIGYGLDYDEKGRNLKGIYQLKEEV